MAYEVVDAPSPSGTQARAQVYEESWANFNAMNLI
jgi:hypothetical protein